MGVPAWGIPAGLKVSSSQRAAEYATSCRRLPAAGVGVVGFIPVNVTSVLAMRLISGCHGETGAVTGGVLTAASGDGVGTTADSTVGCSRDVEPVGGGVIAVPVDGPVLGPLVPEWPAAAAGVTGLLLAGVGCVVVDAAAAGTFLVVDATRSDGPRPFALDRGRGVWVVPPNRRAGGRTLMSRPLRP